MKAYELLFFVNPTLDEEERQAALQRIETTITSQEGVIDGIEDWGRKKLAFEVDKLTEGDYTLVNFQANPASIDEIDRVLRITDAVKRFKIVCRTQSN